MRIQALALLSAFICSCGPAPPMQESQSDPTREKWYGQAVEELAAMNRQAKERVKAGKADDAAALITKGEPISKRLLSVTQPTLAATIAASDLDELYGQMLFSNRNYGWARLLFQKNLVRWKYWKPQTPDTAERLKRAQDAIAECDSRIGQ
jgi:hypothetical protein